ncbi:hypothetical protein Ancab_033147 [Ancistrocladus abbreviatus]
MGKEDHTVGTYLEGSWSVFFLMGLFLAAYSIIFGVETAQGFRWLVKRIKKDSLDDTGCFNIKSRVDNCKRQLVIIALTLMWGLLWVMSVILEKKEFKNGSSGAQLWLACLVGLLGVWIRWWLARLNGCGLGKQGDMIRALKVTDSACYSSKYLTMIILEMDDQLILRMLQ